MTDRATLYDKPIFSSANSLTLTDQVYEILREEIHTGRWQVGERLPGAAALAEMSGLSRWPIQQAFERLREAGYLRQEARSGSFLASQYPKPEQAVGTIGIALLLAEEMGAWSTDRHSHHRLAALLEAGARRNYLTEVRYLREDEDWDAVDRTGGIFGDRAIGVISLHPFPHSHTHRLAPGRLPFVHTGANTSLCRPLVAGDTHLGYYEMTRLVIAHGHRNIVCYCNVQDSERERANRMLGHEKAMKEAGLTVNREAAEHSLSIPPDDLRAYALRGYLERFHEATAVILMDGTAAGPMIAAANSLGRRVPEDLSITGAGNIPPGLPAPGKTMTTIVYDIEGNMRLCLDLLETQIKTRTCPISRILVTPMIREGDSLAPPAEKRG